MKRTGDGGWRRVRTSKTFERSDSAPSAEPQTRLDRLGGCNGPVQHLVKDGKQVKRYA